MEKRSKEKKPLFFSKKLYFLYDHLFTLLLCTSSIYLGSSNPSFWTNSTSIFFFCFFIKNKYILIIVKFKTRMKGLSHKIQNVKYHIYNVINFHRTNVKYHNNHYTQAQCLRCVSWNYEINQNMHSNPHTRVGAWLLYHL